MEENVIKYLISLQNKLEKEKKKAEREAKTYPAYKDTDNKMYLYLTGRVRDFNILTDAIKKTLCYIKEIK